MLVFLNPQLSAPISSALGLQNIARLNTILLFNFDVVITLNFKLSVFLFAFVLIINDVKRKKLIDIKDNLKAQSTLSLYVSVTSSWRESTSNELPFANFSFLNKYNYICQRHSRQVIVKWVIIESNLYIYCFLFTWHIYRVCEINLK